MAENPLLPDAELRALHALLQIASRAEAAAIRRASKAAATERNAKVSASRAALLAGTLLQLRPGDLFITQPGDALATTVLSSTTPGHKASAPALPAGAPAIMLASAMAAALRTSGTGLVLALTAAETVEPLWPEALAWAQDQQLPLVLVCADPSGPNAFRDSSRTRNGALTWGALARTTRRLGLPVLSVDGEDAVAVYRVMQESVLRARAGGGPAILWAALPRPADLRSATRPSSANPLPRLKRYLRTRRVSL